MSEADWELLREDVAAEILRLSVHTLRAGRSSGLLDCYLPEPVRQGRRVFYRRADVEQCLEGRLTHPKLRRKYLKHEEGIPA